jgi:hypothetical protein
MSLLRKAIAAGRWDLAAYALVLAAIKTAPGEKHAVKTCQKTCR